MVVDCRVVVERDVRLKGVLSVRAALMKLLKIEFAAPGQFKRLGVRHERLSNFDLNLKILKIHTTSERKECVGCN